jgi:hypothetical protein
MKMSSAVTGLKDALSNTVDNSLVIMQGFKSGTKQSIDDFITSYKYLTKPIYKGGTKNGVAMAVDKLSVVEKRAKDMEQDANGLAAKFDSIENVAQEVTKKIMDERDLDVQKKTEANNKLAVFEKKAEALKQVKENLDKEVSEYSERYNTLSKQIEVNENRSYKLALTATIIGGISAMFGGGQVNTAQPEQSGTGTAGGADVDNKTEANYKESEAKVKSLEERSNTLKDELEQVKEKLAAETDEEEKAKLSRQQDDLTKEKEEVDKQLEAAKGEKDVYQKALCGFSDGLNKTSEKINEMAEKIDAKNETQYDRLDRIAKQKAELQKEQREAITQMAEMASEIARATTVSRDLEICISSLITAVGCMRIVKVYLSNIALFWKNVSNFSKALVERVSELNGEVANFVDAGDYCEIFKDESFVNAFLLNLVSWAALESISEEYLDAFNKTRNKYQELELAGESTPEEHWKRAQESAKQLNVTLNNKMKTLD